MTWTYDPPQICWKCRRFHNRRTASGRWPAVITVCPQCDRSGKTAMTLVSPNDLGQIITYRGRGTT
jgi:hypothetical protein